MRLRARIDRKITYTLFVALALSSGLWAQQKGQWVPGQYGLNAGVIPDPGFTYLIMPLNYSASRINDSNGNRVASGGNAAGTYSFWVQENLVMYVPKFKILGGYYAPYALIPFANGSVVADIQNYGGNAGGEGLADTFYSPATLGWHFDRADLSLGYGFTAPTGRYSPGASDNVGSGYWGNNLLAGATGYLTKNKGTSANLFLDWEGHGQKSGTNITPGQAVTIEWGLGQALPLDKQTHKVVQLGWVGYDQWQVSNNSGVTAQFPYYSSHGMGVQSNFLVPEKGLILFFKYYGEYSAKAAPQGRTFVFGGAYTFKTKTK